MNWALLAQGIGSAAQGYAQGKTQVNRQKAEDAWRMADWNRGEEKMKMDREELAARMAEGELRRRQYEQALGDRDQERAIEAQVPELLKLVTADPKAKPSELIGQLIGSGKYHPRAIQQALQLGAPYLSARENELTLGEFTPNIFPAGDPRRTIPVSKFGTYADLQDFIDRQRAKPTDEEINLDRQTRVGQLRATLRTQNRLQQTPRQLGWNVPEKYLDIPLEDIDMQSKVWDIGAQQAGNELSVFKSGTELDFLSGPSTAPMPGLGTGITPPEQTSAPIPAIYRPDNPVWPGAAAPPPPGLENGMAPSATPAMPEINFTGKAMPGANTTRAEYSLPPRTVKVMPPAPTTAVGSTVPPPVSGGNRLQTQMQSEYDAGLAKSALDKATDEKALAALNAPPVPVLPAEKTPAGWSSVYVSGPLADHMSRRTIPTRAQYEQRVKDIWKAASEFGWTPEERNAVLEAWNKGYNDLAENMGKQKEKMRQEDEITDRMMLGKDTPQQRIIVNTGGGDLSSYRDIDDLRGYISMINGKLAKQAVKQGKGLNQETVYTNRLTAEEDQYYRGELKRAQDRLAVLMGGAPNIGSGSLPKATGNTTATVTIKGTQAVTQFTAPAPGKGAWPRTSNYNPQLVINELARKGKSAAAMNTAARNLVNQVKQTHPDFTVDELYFNIIQMLRRNYGSK